MPVQSRTRTQIGAECKRGAEEEEKEEGQSDKVTRSQGRKNAANERGKTEQILKSAFLKKILNFRNMRKTSMNI